MKPSLQRAGTGVSPSTSPGISPSIYSRGGLRVAAKVGAAVRVGATVRIGESATVTVTVSVHVHVCKTVSVRE